MVRAAHWELNGLKSWRRIVVVDAHEFVVLQVSVCADFITISNYVVRLGWAAEPLLQLSSNKTAINKDGISSLKHDALNGTSPSKHRNTEFVG